MTLTLIIVLVLLACLVIMPDFTLLLLALGVLIGLAYFLISLGLQMFGLTWSQIPWWCWPLLLLGSGGATYTIIVIKN